MPFIPRCSACQDRAGAHRVLAQVGPDGRGARDRAVQDVRVLQPHPRRQHAACMHAGDHAGLLQHMHAFSCCARCSCAGHSAWCIVALLYAANYTISAATA